MPIQVAHLSSLPCPFCGQMVPVARVTTPDRVEYVPKDDVHLLRNEHQLGVEEPMVAVIYCRLYERGN